MADLVVNRCNVLSLFQRNPELLKVALLGGLIANVKLLGQLNVINELASAEWGDAMTRNQSIVFAICYAISVLSGGPLGRLGDKVGLRLTFALSGLLVSLPNLAILIFGYNGFGLRMCCVAIVISGIGCVTQTGSPIHRALIGSVTLPEDLDLASGISSGVILLSQFLGVLSSALVVEWFPQNSQTAVLLYTLMFTLLLFATCAWIRVPSEPASLTPMPSPLHSRPPPFSLPSSSTQESAMARSSSGLVASARLVWSISNLRNGIMIAALGTLPETLLGDIAVQYAFQCLDMQGASHKQEQQRVSSLACSLAYILNLLFFPLVGLLAKHIGSVRALKYAIPVAAAMQGFPMLLHFVPQLWIGVLAMTFVTFSQSVMIPLQFILTDGAPHGHLGEVMGLTASAKSAMSFLAYAVAILASDIMFESGQTDLMWTFFLAAFFISLCMLPFAWQLKDHRASKS